MGTDRSVLTEDDFTSRRSRPTHQMTTTQIYQNCIVTDWQCIGTHWQTSRQSIANSVTNPCMSWELEYYRDRPKCLDGGPFRLSVFTPAPILFCHSANIHRSANPMSNLYQSIDPLLQQIDKYDTDQLSISCFNHQKMDRHRFSTHWHKSRQSYTNRRPVP